MPTNQSLPVSPVPNAAAADGQPVELFTLNGDPVYTGGTVTVSGSGGGGTTDDVARSVADAAYDIAVDGTNAALAAQSTASAGSNVGLSAYQIAQTGTNYFIATSGSYYVRPDGNDANSGTFDSSTAAWKTIQHGLDYLTSHVIDSAAIVQLRIADGTYAESVSARRNLGGGTIEIVGNKTTPANVMVTGAPAFNFTGAYTLSHLKVTSPSTHAIFVRQGSYLTVGDGMHFGFAAGAHLRAIECGVVQAVGTYTISGSATSHWNVDKNSSAALTAGRANVIGLPGFSAGFCKVTTASSMVGNGGAFSFSGAATGSRYDVSLNGVIFIANGGANYFPGSSAGVASTGGLYT